MKQEFRRFATGVAVVAFWAAFAGLAIAETKIGSTVESRILLGFKVDDVAAGNLLPSGWTPVTLPKGPVSGSNLIVALIDRHVILDADGKPGDPSSGPTAAFFVYARKDGVEGIRGFVTRVYEEPPVVDPYGNSVIADISRVAGFSDAGGGERTQTETWVIAPEGGGEIRLELDYEVGGLGWSTGGESRPYSSKNPDFFRIYRYDQLAGLAMSTALGRALNGTVSFVARDPGLDDLVIGTEELVSIVSIPTYIREISLP
jgi:hypothetical protein